MLLTFTILTFFSTLLGGVFALRFSDRLHTILGFTAGVLLAVVAFDLLPEISELAQKTNTDFLYPMMALVGGFMVFHILEKTLLIHHAHEEDYGHHKHPDVGVASALALIGHSFLDGLGIGLAFQVSNVAGFAVALAVLSHDFSDGINTVSLMLSHKNSKKKALAFLAADAFAPALGAISTVFFTLQDKTLLLYLGFFAGFLLYICAGDILPEAHSEKSSWRTILATILGIIFVFTVTHYV